MNYTYNLDVLPFKLLEEASASIVMGAETDYLQAHDEGLNADFAMYYEGSSMGRR
jgi:hypothetical protein